jgi:hopanoid biosynthesis associated protein HpnK
VGCELIINADDFGYSAGVNQAIMEAHRARVLTSCSLMVAEEAAAAAVALAREQPALAVGLHLVLVRGRAALPPGRIPALVGSGGRFREDPVAAGIRYYFSRRARAQVESEIEAQFERFAATGLPLSHVDGHLHFQLHPVVFRAAMELAPRYGCRQIRIPQDDWGLHRRLAAWDAWRQAPLALVFALLCHRNRRRAAAAGLRATDRVLGFYQTGRLDTTYLARLARALPDGTHELHCHPDRSTSPGRRELAALLSREFGAALAGRGVRLTTYPAMSAAGAPA